MHQLFHIRKRKTIGLLSLTYVRNVWAYFYFYRRRVRQTARIFIKLERANREKQSDRVNVEYRGFTEHRFQKILSFIDFKLCENSGNVAFKYEV